MHEGGRVYVCVCVCVCVCVWGGGARAVVHVYEGAWTLATLWHVSTLNVESRLEQNYFTFIITEKTNILILCISILYES